MRWYPAHAVLVFSSPNIRQCRMRASEKNWAPALKILHIKHCSLCHQPHDYSHYLMLPPSNCPKTKCKMSTEDIPSSLFDSISYNNFKNILQAAFEVHYSPYLHPSSTHSQSVTIVRSSLKIYMCSTCTHEERYEHLLNTLT